MNRKLLKTVKHSLRHIKLYHPNTVPPPLSVYLFIIHCITLCFQATVMKYLGALVYAFRWKTKATAGVHACLAFKD